MKLHFFRRQGFIFIPIHFIGWAFMVVLALLAAFVFWVLFIDRNTTGDAFTNFFLYIAILVLGYYFFALFTCKPEKEDFS
jgi:hypothetical protein